MNDDDVDDVIVVKVFCEMLTQVAILISTVIGAMILLAQLWKAVM